MRIRGVWEQDLVLNQLSTFDFVVQKNYTVRSRSVAKGLSFRAYAISPKGVGYAPEAFA